MEAHFVKNFEIKYLQSLKITNINKYQHREEYV